MKLDFAQGEAAFLHIFATKILCWEPVYLENRVNGSHIVFIDKPDVYVDKSAQQIYYYFAKDHCVALRDMRRKYEDAVGKTQNLPLLLTDTWELFSPVKCRINPDNRSDGVNGYVNVRYIERIYPGPNDTAYIALRNGYRMRVFMSSALARERIQESHRFRDIYAIRHMAELPEWAMYAGH